MDQRQMTSALFSRSTVECTQTFELWEVCRLYGLTEEEMINTTYELMRGLAILFPMVSH